MNKIELRQKMAELPEPVTDKKPPHWEAWRYELWHHVVDGDDDLVFNVSAEERWTRAFHGDGIDPRLLSPASGNA